VISTRTPPRKRVRGDPASNGCSKALPSADRNGRLDALAAGGGDSLTGECGQGHGVRAACRASRRRPLPLFHAGGRRAHTRRLRRHRRPSRLAPSPRPVASAPPSSGQALSRRDRRP
jgi:hypothetical protein